MTNPFLGFGVLGTLTWSDEHVLHWTVEIGVKLIALVMFADEDFRSRYPWVEDEREVLLSAMEKDFKAAGFEQTPKEMFQECSESTSSFVRSVQNKVLESHGCNAYALVLLAELIGCVGAFNADDLTHFLDGHVSDLNQNCPELIIDVRRFARILEELGDINAAEWTRLLQYLTAPLTILLLAIDARDEPGLEISKEREKMEEAIKDSGLSHALVAKGVLGGKMRDFTTALIQHPPAVLHLSSVYGSFPDILLEDAFGFVKPVPKDMLKNLFATQKQLCLVILSACCSQELARTIADLVGRVIGLSGTVLDVDCFPFLKELYLALSQGLDCEAAFNRANLAVASTSDAEFHFIQRTATIES